MFFLVDVNGNVAHVEVFSSDHPVYVEKKLNEEFLIPVKSGDTIFTGKENHLLKKGNKYRLIHTPWPDGKIYGVKLKPYADHSRTIVQSPSPDSKIKEQTAKVSTPDSSVASPIIPVISGESFNHESLLSDSLYIMKAGRSADSSIARRDTLLHRARISASSYSLMAKVRRKDPVFKDNDFMKETPAERQEYLISYDELHSFTQPEILNGISAQEHEESIQQEVTIIKSSSFVQNEILQPDRKSTISDRLKVLLVALVIATEIAAIASLAYWVFISKSLSI